MCRPNVASVFCDFQSTNQGLNACLHFHKKTKGALRACLELQNMPGTRANERGVWLRDAVIQ